MVCGMFVCVSLSINVCMWGLCSCGYVCVLVIAYYACFLLRYFLCAVSFLHVSLHVDTLRKKTLRKVIIEMSVSGLTLLDNINRVARLSTPFLICKK